MEKEILICLDSASAAHPERIGLPGESLLDLPWMQLFCTAEISRAYARSVASVREVWVVSCDDMSAINVAAALKMDDPCKKVFLVSDGNGSLASRVSNARLDGLMTRVQFAQRFMQKKTAFADGPHSLNGGQDLRGTLPQRETIDRQAEVVSGSSQGCVPAGVEGGALGMQGSWPSVAAQAKVVEHRANLVHRSASAMQEPAGIVLSVFSGSGGSGKSTVAAVYGLLCAQAGLKTVVVDADLQFGDMHHLLAVEEPLRVDDVVDNPNLMATLQGSTRQGMPALLACPKRIERADAVASELPLILEALRGSFDVVIANTGAFWSEAQAVVLEQSEAVTFLVDARPSSLRSVVHAVELCSRIGMATSSFTFAVNKHEKSSLLSAVDVSCALRGAHAVELPHGGREVDELLGAGYVGEFLGSKNPFLLSTADLLVRVVPDEKKGKLQEFIPSLKKRKTLFGKGA